MGASGVSSTMRVGLTAGGSVGSMTGAVSFDQSVSSVLMANRASTGSVSVTVSGSGLSMASY
eukprot:1013669-Rhodomonas_salina.1